MFGALSLYEKNSRWLRVEPELLLLTNFVTLFGTQKGIFEYSLKLKIIIPFDVYIFLFKLLLWNFLFAVLLQNTGQI